MYKLFLIGYNNIFVYFILNWLEYRYKTNLINRKRWLNK